MVNKNETKSLVVLEKSNILVSCVLSDRLKTPVAPFTNMV